MNWMNYHHLYYFYTIAREGSVARAAEKLRLGQPTLSTQLKQLEEAIGKPLFERQSRGMKLTESGKLVYEYAQEIFRLGGEMLEAVNDRLRPERMHIQIGALDSVPKHLIHDLVAMAYRISDCYVSVLEGPREMLLRELQAHRLDLVLTNSPAPIAPKSLMMSRRVSEMKVLVCGAPKFSKLRSKFPQSLDQQPLVLPTIHSQLRVEVERYLEKHALVPKLIGETQDSVVQKMLALSGHALIAIAEPAVQDDLKEGRLVKIGEISGVKEQLWLTSAARFIENPVAAKLMTDF